MPIKFDCEGCGQPYTVTDASAGKVGKCKQCGHAMTVPDPYRPALADDQLERFAPEPPVRLDPVTPRPSLFGDPAAEPVGGSSKALKQFFSGLLTVVVVLGGIGLRVYTRFERKQRNRANAQAPAAPANPNADAARFAAARSGPIRLPKFPDLGPAQDLEPGVSFRELTLGKPDPYSPPGFSGKLWLYLPSGDHADGSLPCVLITGAGSTLVAGMELGEGDVPEHLPYVRAGYAVLAFELDGMVKRENPTDAEVRQGMERFLRARAGLVNAHIALEFLLAKVPQVDPDRLTAAGHSSAGTLALLFAEYEPRIARCIAYAPATRIEQHFRAFNSEGSVLAIRQLGFGDLIDLYSPHTRELQLKCPLFFFNSEQDDMGFEAREMAARLKASGKPVTLLTVPTGDHYQSMIEPGIPAAIDWLKAQDAKE